MIEIRRALLTDAKGIHDSHMQSIKEVCAPYYSEAEIMAWGGRDFDQAWRENFITNDQVYVVLIDNLIEGHIHFKKFTATDLAPDRIYLNALYFTKKLVGKNIGKKLWDIMENFARVQKAEEIFFTSSLNSLGFYQKMGCIQVGEVITVSINNENIRCIRMKKIIL